MPKIQLNRDMGTCHLMRRHQRDKSKVP